MNKRPPPRRLVKKQERGLGLNFFRHAFAVHRHETGLGLLALRRYLGHFALMTTQWYDKADIRIHQGDYARIHPLLNDGA